MKKHSIYILIISLLIGFGIKAQTVKILFDATQAEMAGNADWIIDADLHNIGFQNGRAEVGLGYESNPQWFPTPLQLGITGSTSETYWEGALSSWGIDCVKKGYEVETLPYNGKITFGNSLNAQDLSNYKMFIVCEPNFVFTASEKIAIINFVNNGGGLFMISNHDISDRDGDGWDAPHIWNDLMSNNTVQTDPFGISFDYVNIYQTSTNIPSLPGDSIINGPMGNVTQVLWANGTTITLNPAKNSTVLGVIFTTGSSFGDTNVMCAYARFGNGKVAAIGDSAPCDDGTGDPYDFLYNGYTGDAAGNHRKLLMNITIWLAASDALSGISGIPSAKNNFRIYPNPSVASLSIDYTLLERSPVFIQLIDEMGRTVFSIARPDVFPGTYTESINVEGVSSGIYLCSFLTPAIKESRRVVLLR